MSERGKLVTLGVIGAVLAVVVLVVLVGRGGDDDDSSIATPVTKDVKLSRPEPGSVVQPGEKASVKMETTEGDFTISLDTENWPVTANSFAYLTEEKFYDGLGFHRIVPDFVIQGGDPTGTGSGGPGYSVVETPPKSTTYPVGTVAMAKTGAEAPGTSGSQFFIVTGAQGSSLTPDYSIAGTVSEGLEVVKRIGELGSASEQPTKQVVIEKATLEKG
ncbi:MAG TPA: peptidylprolyl isomerase [Solirubrobacterales bacterium]|jgi:cyclophilin family peptidyl-prolyl cis-trans isomerase|nr:peptidylprolyl isomerase [Solirubrobacterales bacterium]HMU26692.1 peptidylprolyl isomerase [Solirubrobacterales bacterium]HMW44628.1 peptidylprolyl isomerase [Solirubrobacterales bacterium]HMX71065.1 peptidylprolyl isomerase [Solirubrobacterales bacterium]HMY24713.1 peptidylprolyl isomerase [Solirubrobacterales bacterium]